MVSPKDVEQDNLPTSSNRFEYLLATCKVEQQKLLPEEDDADDDEFDRYYLHDGITNVVEHPSTCKSGEPKPALEITIVEEVKKGICLTKQRSLGKATTKPRSDAPESGASSSSEDGEAAPELNTSPNGKSKRSNKRKRSGGNNSEEPPPELPAEIKGLILHLPPNRVVSEEKLVIKKELTVTDVSNHHNRLSIPKKRLHETFLTEEEDLKLCTRDENNNLGSMDVLLITPMMEVVSVSLRRWDMPKKRGNPSINYVLTSTWNKIKEQNRLRNKMEVQLWAFRIDGHLCMALTLLTSPQ